MMRLLLIVPLLLLAACGGAEPTAVGRRQTVVFKVVRVGVPPICDTWKGLPIRQIVLDGIGGAVKFPVVMPDLCTGTALTLPSMPPYDEAKMRQLSDMVGDHEAYKILIVDGPQVLGGSIRVGVAGANYQLFGYMGIFLPYARGADGDHTAGTVGRTIVHEFGHALGLVGDLIPQVTKHEDLSVEFSPFHCKVRGCVMYWSVSSGDVDRLSNVVGGNRDLFDPLCKADLAELRDLSRLW